MEIVPEQSNDLSLSFSKWTHKKSFEYPLETGVVGFLPKPCTNITHDSEIKSLTSYEVVVPCLYPSFTGLSKHTVCVKWEKSGVESTHTVNGNQLVNLHFNPLHPCSSLFNQHSQQPPIPLLRHTAGFVTRL